MNRSKLLGAAVAVLLAAALVVTGRHLDLDGGVGRRPGATTVTISTRAPVRIAGKVECPPDWPVLATADHHSYPAGHPGRPRAGVSVVGCYQTAEQAGGAGYAPAPPPPGILEIGGVYLVPPARPSGTAAGEWPTGSASRSPAQGCCRPRRRASRRRGCATVPCAAPRVGC